MRALQDLLVAASGPPFELDVVFRKGTQGRLIELYERRDPEMDRANPNRGYDPLQPGLNCVGVVAFEMPGDKRNQAGSFNHKGVRVDLEYAALKPLLDEAAWDFCYPADPNYAGRP